ncbi:AAA family ATPase [Thiocystis violascens]|uniref:Putative kinase n=1 Tax=Thiocystis violascens (strain ATCC 17096 / DSM 198 / 6111) TaxID=765911 RepID=I3YC39_THIV6|nr:AAA family ATPase [Thiocystis violascens]AFL74557.1 putative kinase [Thiocystis violascens DSM 198]
MEAVILSGIQAAGKSSFYKARLADSHLRLNLDMLRTRHRERVLLAACLEAKQPFVVDNTNLTQAERAVYIEAAREARFRVVGYCFWIDLETALARNALRERRRPVPDKAIRASLRRWEIPRLEEGFDLLWEVRAVDGDFRLTAAERL